jgi:hypothetical protein
MFMKKGSVTGEMYFFQTVADNPDKLTGIKQSFWSNSMSLFGSTTEVTATRISRTVLSLAGSNQPKGAFGIMNSMSEVLKNKNR